MSDASILNRLRRPLLEPDGDRTFRLGIVLNGTVSAGAWTAGVLDFLVEALDAWEGAKAEGREVPDHRVRIDILGGASGGGVCAALLARAATCTFPHARDASGAAGNPFWEAWVEALDIARMLGVSDLSDPAAPAASLMDRAAIDLAGEAVLRWGPGTAPGIARLPAPRPWLGDPFRVLVTLTNLRGVPYRLDFAPGADGAPRASHYVDHADHALFAFPARPGEAAGLRGDEWCVGPDFDSAAADWARFADYAKATGAFPIGFPPRRLSRPAAHYDWRGVALPGGMRDGRGGEPRLVLRRPSWDTLPPAHRPDASGGLYVFDCVDGGALNNQPVELVRTCLAGLGGALERDAAKADAAVLVIDPFAAAPECPVPQGTPDLFEVAGALAGAWKSQARHATSDLMLALDPGTFSRFLLTAGRTAPEGGIRWGGAALASSGLGAFMGFLSRELRVHDYLLGRKNCRDYLRNHFVLDAANPVFGGFARHPAAAEYLARPRPGAPPQMPIVPLVPGTPRQPQEVPPWPIGGAPLRGIEGRIERRLRAVAGRLAARRGIDIPCESLVIGGLAERAAEGFAARLRAAMGEAGLG